MTVLFLEWEYTFLKRLSFTDKEKKKNFFIMQRGTGTV